MAIDVDFLRKRLESGIIFYLGARITDEISTRLARKYLQEHADAAVGLGISLLAEMLGGRMGREIRSYIDDIVDAAADYGLYREIKILAEKEPVCFAKDANTIVCKNLENLDGAEVFIDGNKLARGSEYVVSGNEIQLSKPLPSGVHDLVVVDGTGRKAFHGKIYV